MFVNITLNPTNHIRNLIMSGVDAHVHCTNKIWLCPFFLPNSEPFHGLRHRMSDHVTVWKPYVAAILFESSPSVSCNNCSPVGQGRAFLAFVIAKADVKSPINTTLPDRATIIAAKPVCNICNQRLALATAYATITPL